MNPRTTVLTSVMNEMCLAAVRPCKRFVEQNLGARRIYSARSFHKRTGICKKRSQSKRLRSLFVKRIPPAVPVVLKSFSYAKKKYPPLVE